MSVEIVVLLNIVFWNRWYFFFDEYKVKKNSICLKYKYKSLL